MKLFKTKFARLGAPLLISAGLLVSAGAVQAFGPKHHGYGDGDPTVHIEHRVAKMTRWLDLSADQQEQLKVLFASKHEMRSERRGSHHGESVRNLDPNAADYQQQLADLAEENAERARAATLRKAEFHAQFLAILTEEQQAKLKEAKGKREHWRGQRGERSDQSGF